MSDPTTPALPLIRARLQRLGLELRQLRRPQTREQYDRACLIFREIEEAEQQLAALVALAEAEVTP